MKRISFKNYDKTGNIYKSEAVIRKRAVSKASVDVSVIVPVFNNGPTLETTIPMLLGQSLRTVEFIFVDDGSKDNSISKIEQFCELDDRITLIQQNHAGAGVARNAGLSIARGKYVIFLDADDYFSVDLIKTAFEASLRQQSKVLVFQHRIKRGENQTPPTGIFYNSSNRLITVNSEELENSWLTLASQVPWNKMIDREFLISRDIYFQNLIFSNDIFFSSLLFANLNKVSLLYCPLITYVMGTKTLIQRRKEEFKKDLTPSFIFALSSLKHHLKKKGCYEKYKASFGRLVLSSIKWTLEKVPGGGGGKLISNLEKAGLLEDIYRENKDDLFGTYRKMLDEPNVIVSVTSFPDRIKKASASLVTLLNQSIKPYKTILWLSEDEFPNLELDLPPDLLALKEQGLEIMWDQGNRKSFKKLLPALEKYPDCIIVTADDDLLYHHDWLFSLCRSYLTDRQNVHCHRVTRLFFYDSDNVTEANASEKLRFVPQNLLFIGPGYRADIKLPSSFNKPCTGSGCLFPPKTFDSTVFNEKLYQSLCPSSDDIWFYLCALRKKKKVRVPEISFSTLSYVEGTQDCALCSSNDKFHHKTFFNHLTNVFNLFKKEIFPFFLLDNTSNSFIVDEIYLEYFCSIANKLRNNYHTRTGDRLSLSNPLKFSEKIQWSKLFDSTGYKSTLTDKLAVRKYVEEKIGKEYLIPILGVYECPEDIDFSKLPVPSVIKCNHGCGFNIILKPGEKVNVEEIKQKLSKWMNINFSFSNNFELHYYPIKPRIYVEKYIENTGDHDVFDYKFWCFNGKVKFIQFLSERNTNGLKMLFLTPEWKPTDYVYDHSRLDFLKAKKPKNLSKMIGIAEKLSFGFNHVRVDLYNISEKIYFGELTFTSASGLMNWSSEGFDFELGKEFKLPVLKFNCLTGKNFSEPAVKKIASGLETYSGRKKIFAVSKNMIKQACPPIIWSFAKRLYFYLIKTR